VGALCVWGKNLVIQGLVGASVVGPDAFAHI